MPDFREYEDVVFIAGQTFQSEFGTHVAGTEVEEAKEFHNLQVLIDAKFLYPIAPEAGYNYLPPNLFNHINVREEVMAKLTGALSPNPDHFANGKKPESLLLAEREARQKLTEGRVDTKAAKEARKAAREEARTQTNNLQTVDANPAVQDKGSEVAKMYKGKAEAWEVLEEQSETTRKRKEATLPSEEDMPVNLREDKKDLFDESKLKDEENPDKAASKKPVEETDAVADPVGEQPSNTSPTGARDAKTGEPTGEKKTAAKKTAAAKKTTQSK